MSDAVNEFLQTMLAEIDKATSVKVTKAMRLFNRVDDTYKSIVLQGARLNTGSTDKLARSIREHFEMMDLLDMLDSAIEDMEDELKNNPEYQEPSNGR